jgi:hypothetical protein
MRRLLGLVLVGVGACNQVLGIEDVTVGLDGELAQPDRRDSGTSSAEASTDVVVPLPPADAGSDAGYDAGFDAGPRPPDPGCLKATNPQDAVKRVELDTSPAPVSDATTTSGFYSIYGDNALTNVHLDFCTPEGASIDVGGGFNYLGGGGAVTRRWQTKNAVKLPKGRNQAQVRADGSPSLKLVYDIILY